MAIARSRLTSQGRATVPAAIRRRLGLGPGSVLEWDDDGDRIVVRRQGATHPTTCTEPFSREAGSRIEPLRT
jgi:AbrB family looped-hinge helix DNA binding protein